MLVSIDWIKDFTDLGELPAVEVGNKFTLSTAEVEGVQSIGEHFKKIKVAVVESINKHPNADKLSLVTFRVSQNETGEVVCGASNVKVGMKTPYAPLGTVLAGGFKLEPKKIRGVLSEGMLCSKEELGYEQNSKGIMELPEDAPVGMTLLEYLNESVDTLLDIDNKSLTHRPDLWGHYGMAREFATIFEKTLKNPFSDEWSTQLEKLYTLQSSPITLQVDPDCSCLAYFGLSINGVKVEDSPIWMQKRLKAVGLRPINNIVDISNYVMLELGIPLHIFDQDKIKGGKLIIQRMKKEDSFKTLDEIERKLLPSDTVICDNSGPLVLAGIMGGQSSEIDDQTQNVFIEVANWKAHEVRRTSTRLGLRTDSSSRYEKTLDSKMCKRTMLRTLELIIELCPNASVVGKLEYDGHDLSSIATRAITTSISKINSVLGHRIEKGKIISIFKSLDFIVEEDIDGDLLQLLVPSFRANKDIEYEADLIEEVGRIIGYDNITPKSPLSQVSPVRLTLADKLHRKIRNFMVYHAKSYEIMTYPMVGKKLYKKAAWSIEQGVKIINPISEDQDVMRPSLIPSLLEAASKNQKNFSDFCFFEIGRTYTKDQVEFSKEQSMLGVVFSSKDSSCFMELLNVVERLFTELNVAVKFNKRHANFANAHIPADWDGRHPFEHLDVNIMGKIHGAVITPHPIILKSFKIKGNLSMAIIDLTSFQDRPLKSKTKYTTLLKFPTSTFDCTVVADKGTPVQTVLECMKKSKVKKVIDQKVVDVFQFNETQNTVTLRTTFGDHEGTLSGQFLDSAKESIVESLKKGGFNLKM
ncbi:MAG: phenylalanine--tRNA ligase subunit beta [Bacteriovoracaceae bacterium]|nr:phenylalanine--tRNA ligase subunit beta [Bacteriovoracaceae bacterium]